MSRSFLFVGAVAASLGLIASASTAQQHSSQHQERMSGGSMGPMMQGMHGAHETMKQRMDAAMMRGGDPEKAFVEMMIPHHQGAVDMGKAALPHINDPELRRMTEHTIEQNQKEIDQMRAWQQKNK